MRILWARSGWIAITLTVLVGVQACSSHKLRAVPRATVTNAPGIFTGPVCELVDSTDFTSVVGSKIGPGTNQAMPPLGNGITGRLCGAVANNFDLFSVGMLHYPTASAAARSFEGITTRPPLGHQLPLTGGLAPRQYAAWLIQGGGVEASAYLLDGRDELVVLVAATPQDAHLFSPIGFEHSVEDVARRWRHP